MHISLVRNQILSLINDKKAHGKTDQFDLHITLGLQLSFEEEIINHPEIYGSTLQGEVLLRGIQNTFPTLYGFLVRWNAEALELKPKAGPHVCTKCGRPFGAA